MKTLGLTLFLMAIPFGLATAKNTDSKSPTNTYELNIDLTIGGKVISKPKVILKENKKATITQKTKTDENFIEVTASEAQMQDKKGIMMKFSIGTIDKEGKMTVISKPHIMALENEKAQIIISKEDSGTEEIALAVTAVKK